MESLIHDPLTRLLAQITAIVVVSHGLGWLGRRIDQPKVIAEVTAGILLGPSLLGWLWPGTGEVLFPQSSLGALQLISQLGLIFFMFIVGLELDPKLLREKRHASVLISHASIVVPFALGSGLSIYLYPTLAEPGTSELAFSLFMGAAMSITAFPVLARILSERRLMQTPIGSLAIACAAVDDVTAWCILAFVVATARATGLDSAVYTTIAALSYIAAMVWLVRPLLQRVAARIPDPESLGQTTVAGILLLLLLSSWSTELIGIHALFGAFLFGAILPKQGGLAHTVAAKIEDLVLIILLPLFFAYSGVRTQIGLLDSAQEWGWCALIIAAASVGKFGAGTLAARVTGIPWREAGAVGALMNTRGLMELIVLNIGLDLGVIGPTLFTMMVLMALVTTFATTPLLRLLIPTGELVAPPPPQPVSVQVPQLVNAGPDYTMLLCIADGRIGPGMAQLAHALADERSEVYAVHLVEPSDRGSFLMAPRPDARDGALEPLLVRAQGLELPVSPLTFVSSDPAGDICDLASGQEADLVLLGLHKPLVGQARLGGVVYSVLRQASTDVAVLLDRDLREIRRVLLPFFGGRNDRSALRIAQRLLRHNGLELTVLQVTGPGQSAEAARASLSPALGSVPFKHQLIEHEYPEEAALDELRTGYDLVVVGLESTWGLEERPFGVQPDRLVQQSDTSVLIVRGRLDVPLI